MEVNFTSNGTEAQGEWREGISEVGREYFGVGGGQNGEAVQAQVGAGLEEASSTIS